jgi:hypothetical protein
MLYSPLVESIQCMFGRDEFRLPPGRTAPRAEDLAPPRSTKPIDREARTGITNLLRFRAITGNNYVIQAEYRQAASITKTKLHWHDQRATTARPRKPQPHHVSLMRRKSGHVKKFNIDRHISETASGGAA